jgi:hypothetical protein
LSLLAVDGSSASGPVDCLVIASAQSHEVGQQEALADETAAKARAAQAEAEAIAAHSEGLRHQAQARRTDAATSRSELNREFERADKIDPDSPTSDTPCGDDAGQQVPPRMPKAG